MGSRTIGSLIVKLGLDPKAVDVGLKKFEKDLMSTARKMESVGKTMSIGFTAPFILGVRHAVKAASDAEETFSKFSVVYSKVSKDAERSFQLLRNQYGLSSTASKKLLSDTGDLLTGFGFSQSAALDLSTQVQTLAVDLASFTNFSGGAEGASQALTKALLGERESVKALGIAILESDVKAKVALLTSQGMTFETERQAKAYATLQIAMEQSKNAQGDYARTQNSFANQSRLLKERVNDLAVEFGQVMLPAAQKLVKNLQEIVEWFKELSPATKEYIVQIGALVAMAGPILYLTGNVIKLAAAFKGLAVSLKAVAMVGGGAVGAAIGIGAAEAYAWENLSPTGSNFAANVANTVMSATGGLYKGSTYGQHANLIPGLGGATNSGFLAPPAAAAMSGGGGGGPAGDIIVAGQGIARAMRYVTSMLTPNRGGNGIGSIQPNLNPAMAGGVGLGLSQLSGVGGHGQAIADMMNIQPDLTADLDAHYQSVEALNEGYVLLGNTLGSVMTSMADSLAEGGNAFAAFGKAALMAAAQVAKAALVESLASATKKGAAVAGAPGIIIGAIAGIAAISIVEGMIGKMKTPKLAQGGVVTGPTLAMIGDNQSGKEMALPWEKTREFAGMISQYMGGGGSSVHGIIRGNDIHLVTSREQGFAARRGSGNLIQF